MTEYDVIINAELAIKYEVLLYTDSYDTFLRVVKACQEAAEYECETTVNGGRADTVTYEEH